ncbi:CotD family spore coat protein [Effusibacillus dendaii]|uniref:CotD family spore coat protein n=1 Tax=Effusibacillus dendaii TaxID=2743772 RepID=UPI00190E43A5|nr:CotD family spore coat protein [Effusibacillus dendaii]
MKKDSTRQIAGYPGVPGQVQPWAVPGAPVQPWATPGVTPAVPTAPVAAGVPAVPPVGMAPAAALPGFPMGMPVTVAPVRRIVHPTRIIERHTTTRFPVINVYPTHTKNVHHNIYEYYCEYPHTASNECCEHCIDHCCPPPSNPC